MMKNIRMDIVACTDNRFVIFQERPGKDAKIFKVLKRADITEEGHATMEAFNGHN